MLWFKYSLVIAVLISSSAHANLFGARVCMMAKFDTAIKHEGKFFGLVKNDLKISKNECNIEIKYKTILDTTWKIDICREPVHIKVLSKGSMEVFKRKYSCDESSDKFCKSWIELKGILQDHGLIFAEGERETLESSHGKTYCTYLLLQKYLGEGELFSKYKNPVDIFAKRKIEKKEAVKVKEKKPSSSSDETEAKF